MRSFPLFAELEEERDKVNATFHKNTKPQLLERLKEFGFIYRPLSPRADSSLRWHTVFCPSRRGSSTARMYIWHCTIN